MMSFRFEGGYHKRYDDNESDASAYISKMKEARLGRGNSYRDVRMYLTPNRREAVCCTDLSQLSIAPDMSNENIYGARTVSVTQGKYSKQAWNNC